MGDNSFQRPLIHIGMPRAGSTYLQRMFERARHVCYLHHEINDLSRRRTLLLLVANLSMVSLFSRRKVVFSHEGLLSHTKNAVIFRVLQNAQILYVTRSPAKWIMSMYCHEVRKGCSLKFENWVRHNQEYLLASLNFNKIFYFCCSLFPVKDVYFLPFELLARDPARFIESIKRHFGLVLDRSIVTSGARNPSLPMKSIETIRRLNRVFEILVEKQNRDVLLKKDFADETKRFLRLFHEIGQWLLPTEDGLVDLQSIKRMTDVLTKVLIQNSSYNTRFMDRLSRDVAETFEEQSFAFLEELLGKKIRKNMRVLCRFPEYEGYLDHYENDLIWHSEEE